jgi:hypothetical protein
VKHCPTGALAFEDRVEVPLPAVPRVTGST